MGLNVQLLRESFRAIRPHAMDVVERFYAELFKAHPEARGLFNLKSMTKQHKALVKSLAHIVEFVEEKEHLEGYLQKLGARHLDYGIKEEHYEWVGEALLETLAFAFDNQWTEELNDTWTNALTMIASEMKTGMRKEAERRANMQEQEPTENVRIVSPAPTPSALKDLANRLSQDLIKSTIEAHFASGEIQELIQAKARELLVRAIEKEAKALFAEAKREQASA